MILPASDIIFIGCRNHHHMKNNIRYKGNINNTSVIIFLIDTLVLFHGFFHGLLRHILKSLKRPM